MDFRMVMDSLDGKMVLFIVELITMGKDKVMDSFITLKTQV